MPAGVIVKETVFGGAGTNANVLAGSQFTLITEPSVVSVGVTGTPTAVLTFGINVGNRLVVEQGTSPPVATVMPIIPDQFFYTFPALPGEQLQIAVTTTAIATFRCVVQIAAA